MRARTDAASSAVKSDRSAERSSSRLVGPNGPRAEAIEFKSRDGVASVSRSDSQASGRCACCANNCACTVLPAPAGAMTTTWRYRRYKLSYRALGRRRTTTRDGTPGGVNRCDKIRWSDELGGALDSVAPVDVLLFDIQSAPLGHPPALTNSRNVTARPHGIRPQACPGDPPVITRLVTSIGHP